MVSATKYDPLATAHPSASSTAKARELPAAAAESRKRKRGNDALTQKSITIRPCPSSPFDRPTTLAPVKLIERSQLPLSFLDLAGSSPAIAPTRLFSAYIDALERQRSDDEDVPATPKVLVTRLEADKSLYAVERVQYGVYALCKLGGWVKEVDIGSVPAFSAGLSYTQPLKALKSEDGKGPWWQRAAVSAPSSDPRSERKGGGCLPRISMCRPVPKVAITAAQRRDETDPFVDSAQQLLPADVAASQQPERPQTAEEVFQAIVQQYLEALYLSKTSLAFFTKGPMSRARAAFISRDDASMRMGDLAAFMRSILLQPGPMDKKHREKIPEIVKTMPLPGLSDDEGMAAEKPEKKKKKTKTTRLKPNKEGTYPGEEDYVKKWWVQDRPSSPQGHGQSAGEVLKTRLGELRVRESMAQVILVLEILALEASPSFQAADQEETQRDETQVESQAESQAAPVKKRKPKKPQDLNVLLDLLLDRLCIWQSVEQDETLVKVSKSGGGSKGTLTPSSGKSGTSDKLKNFCVEVILPFYMSRLPEKAAAINKKLGGPSASPAKTSGSGSSSHRSKPGEAAVRTDSRSVQKKRRPLSRVATENATHQPQRQPSLTRSSTDPLLAPTLKREGSEAPSLSSIPIKDARISSSRNSLSQFERFSRRQIDLDAMSKTNEAKLKKKAHIEQELEKAIGTLRKPNRAAAIKDLADSAPEGRQQQQRVSRKPATTTRKIPGGNNNNTILVGATPKRARKTKDLAVLQATPNAPRLNASFMAHELEDAHGTASNPATIIPPSSDPVIPSSAIRPSTSSYVPGSAIPASVIKPRGTVPASSSSALPGGVEETPSRGPAGKTVHWFFPASNGGALPPTTATTTPDLGVSKLAEKLRPLPPPPPPPAFKLSGASSAISSGRRVLGDVEEEGEESGDDEFRGVAAMLRTPTKARMKAKAGRVPVLETPVKGAGGGVVGETPVKGVVGGEEAWMQDSGKEMMDVVPELLEMEGRGVEELGAGVAEQSAERGNDVSIYSALGWDDDDVDELA